MLGYRRLKGTLLQVETRGNKISLAQTSRGLKLFQGIPLNITENETDEFSRKKKLDTPNTRHAQAHSRNSVR
jgi:hypothetical protein